MTHKSPREQFNMRRLTIIIIIIWTCIVTMQHLTAKFNMLVVAGYLNGWHHSLPVSGPTRSSLLSLLSLRRLSSFFYTMNEGEKDASSTLRHVAEQLLAFANAGKFYSLLSKKLFVNIVIKWTHAFWLISKVSLTLQMTASCVRSACETSF